MQIVEKEMRINQLQTGSLLSVNEDKRYDSMSRARRLYVNKGDRVLITDIEDLGIVTRLKVCVFHGENNRKEVQHRTLVLKNITTLAKLGLTLLSHE